MTETRRRVGDVVEGGPAREPVRDAIQGRFVRLEPLDPSQHALDLFERSHTDAEDEACVRIAERFARCVDRADHGAEARRKRPRRQGVVEELDRRAPAARALRLAERPGDLLRVPGRADHEEAHVSPVPSARCDAAEPRNSGIVA